MLNVGLQHYLILGALLFTCGVLTVLVKRNAIGILMGVCGWRAASSIRRSNSTGRCRHWLTCRW